jgi:uncharacterized membrane protein YvlD (DUF360 family)
MPRFLISWLLGLGANAIALILAALLFPGFTLSVDGFIIALIVFALLSALLPWLVLKFLARHAGSLIALSGLVGTFIALLVTSTISSGLDIDGVWTWIGATLLIWIISMFIWVIPGPWRTFKKRDRDYLIRATQ